MPSSRMKKLLLPALASLLLAHAACGEVVTNTALYRQIQGWENDIRHRKAAKVTREIDAAVRGTAPWSESVLSGTNWSYSWGYLALLAQGWALEWSGRPVEAYRALARAAAFQPAEPPPREHDCYYWRWYVSMGELCSELTRFQDAAWYLEQVRSHLSTNDGFYLKATASLASVLDRQGRLNDAYVLYDELIRLKPEQPPGVWNDYIRFLFDCGFFEDGVEAILRGVEIHGLSPRHREHDFFAVSARRYWHCFSDEQIVAWYELLGRLLDTTRLERGTEDLLAFLINTRTLMKKVYPDLLTEDRDDLAVLRTRSENEPPAGRGLRSAHGHRNVFPDDDDGTAETAAARAAPAPAEAFRGPYATNAAIEDAVNRALLKTLAGKRAGEGRAQAWKDLLEEYGTNPLRQVVVDGVNALFLAYAGLGGACVINALPVEGRDWLAQAVDTYGEGANLARFGDVLLFLADAYMTRWLRKPDKAKEYLFWARNAVRGCRRLEVRVLAGLAGVEILEDGPSDRRIPLLRRIVDQYGYLPQRNIYERLARDYYRTGQFADGFNIYVEGIRRTRFKMGTGMLDHMVDGLIMNRSLHSAEELRRLRRVLRAGALRYPATLREAPAVARMLDLSEASWIAEHEQLAVLEETGGFTSDEGWAVLTNALQRSPSVRAGLLYTAAAFARRPSPDDPVDWTGWLAAWNRVDGEMTSGKPEAPTDSGGAVAAYGLLLDQLEQYGTGMTVKDMEPMYAALIDDVPELSMEQFGRLVLFYRQWDDPDREFGLHLARMSGLRNTSVENPSFQALFALYDHVEPALQEELVSLLKVKLGEARAPELKQRWEQALHRCGGQT